MCSAESLATGVPDATVSSMSSSVSLRGSVPPLHVYKLSIKSDFALLSDIRFFLKAKC